MGAASQLLKDFSNAAVDLVETAGRWVVAVHGREWGHASGIIVKPGVVVTAEEVLDKDEDIEVTLPDGTRVAAKLVGRDPSTDVAVLQFEEGDAKVEAPDAATVRPGSLVFSLGRNGSESIVALGVIAYAGPAWRSSQGGEIDQMIRADLALARAAEGGPLVNAEGKLVGMAVFGPRRRVLAIPYATILRAAEQILAHGSVNRGYIGVSVQSVRVDGGGAERGAMVVGLDPDGPAKAAGVLLGDILLTWDGEAVSGTRSVLHRLGPGSVGQSVKLGLSRAGANTELTLKVGGRPSPQRQ
jgi:S1-C subfamily serine protease